MEFFKFGMPRTCPNSKVLHLWHGNNVRWVKTFNRRVQWEVFSHDLGVLGYSPLDTSYCFCFLDNLK